MQKLTLIFNLVIGILTFGCIGEEPQLIDPVDIYPVVIDVFSEHIEPVSEKCETYLEETRVLEFGAKVTNPLDGDSGRVLDCGDGCHTAWHQRSYIACKEDRLANKVNTCYGHEYLHALLKCMYNDSDHDHENDAIWVNKGFTCNRQSTNRDSTEWYICEILWDMS